MKRPIAISIAPNSGIPDALISLSLFFRPWEHFKHDKIRQVEQWFRQNFTVSHAVSFNSGRTALIGILKSLSISEGDEIIIQAFTCGVVPLAITQVGGKPVYADITDQLTMDPDSVEKKITKKTKAIIFQYTFGIPSGIEAIKKIAEKNNIVLIEDCAHILGDRYGNKKIGMIGDVSFFSFGRDKAISSVFGGIAITNVTHIGKGLREFQKRLKAPSYIWELQQLFHPIAFSLILPVYNILSLGKVILIIFQKLGLLSFPVSAEEKKALKDSIIVERYSNMLASLLLYQCKKLMFFNKNRKQITQFYINELKNTHVTMPYQENLSLLRFPVITTKKEEIIKMYKKKHIYVGDWYSYIIDPKGTEKNKLFYETGMCPKAEIMGSQIINLPTHPYMTLHDAEKVVSVLKKYA